jgi:broad specificity phosphatase PhoE
MRIIFVRHGNPDYANDSLTEKGWQEAEALAKRIKKWNVTDFYCSPLGRAQDTASCTLKAMNRTATTIDWMKEFYYPVNHPRTDYTHCPWDFTAGYWTQEPLYFDQKNWINAPLMQTNPDIATEYERLCKGMDDLLEQYGYRHEYNMYRLISGKKNFMQHTFPAINDVDKAETTNDEPTIVIFCHLGAMFAMMSHILNVPFPVLTHQFFVAPTSVTILNSEERWEDEVSFRVQVLGDTTHLHDAGLPISSAGSYAAVFQEF